jgi:integrase/recombinase XerC
MQHLSRRALCAYLMHLQEQELSPHTVNHFITTMQAFLHFAEEAGHPVSPALYQIRRPQRPDDLPRPLSPADYAKLEGVVLDPSQPATVDTLVDLAWYLVFCDTGVRVSELIAFSVADWDSCNQTLLIRAPKFYHERRIPVADRTAVAIDAHLTARSENLAAENPLLARQGDALSAPYVRSRLHHWAASAQIEQAVTPHRLRHSFATRMLNSGKMPITSLQKLMGHRHIDTTMRYVALYDTTVQRDYLAAVTSLQARPLPEPDPAIWEDALQLAFSTDIQTLDSTQHKINCV